MKNDLEAVTKSEEGEFRQQITTKLDSLSMSLRRRM